MLKNNLVCFLSTALIFVFFIAGVVNGSLTLEEASSCFKCTASTSNKWCSESVAGVLFQGCKISACSVDQSPKPCTDVSMITKLSANCEGCIQAGFSWCVEKVDGFVARKCIEKVENSNLENGHSSCLNGNVYNLCNKSPRDFTVPALEDLDAKPQMQTCADCKLDGTKNWCKKTNSAAPGETQSCVASAGACNDGTYAAACSSTNSAENFYKYSYAPKTCKACVLKEAHLWCSSSQIVGFEGCVEAKHQTTKCPGGNAVSKCHDRSATPKEANRFSKTCGFCRDSGEHWCTSTEVAGKDAVVARSCFSGAQCPSGLTETVDCPDRTKREFYTHLPAVPRELPGTCNQCISSQRSGETALNSWCNVISSSDAVKTCLPAWSFRFYCSVDDAAATTATRTCVPDEIASFKENPFYLQQTCEGCTSHGNEWSITEISNEKYQFCIPKGVSSGFLVGVVSKIVKNCGGLQSQEKEALFPISAKTCEKCIDKNWKWCVHSGFGDKIRICMSTEAADKFCTEAKRGVAFNHCEIAPEDKTVELGLFKLPVNGAPAFASLSLMAIVVALGFSFF